MPSAVRPKSTENVQVHAAFAYGKPCIVPSPKLSTMKTRCKMIKTVKGGYEVVSEKTGKNLGGPYKTKAEAEKRLRQVEFFKHRKG